ncbi:protein broad-minded-like [Astatotilapia calliptera]|uniref:protein broad-minded-like n=1 Tax=Astatotilapia calliptera TaxID=8154 RepID=UPI000E429FD2|nr:protein broad-minded-like [Astatotilapia calliptera]
MHSQWSLKANTFFLSNSCCIYFPLQSFLYLVNLLSSSQSVWQLLGRQSLANKSEYTLREMPTSIPDLIDRLIAVNSDGKIHSLFHYEESHTFGLRGGGERGDLGSSSWRA